MALTAGLGISAAAVSKGDPDLARVAGLTSAMGSLFFVVTTMLIGVDVDNSQDLKDYEVRIKQLEDWAKALREGQIQLPAAKPSELNQDAPVR